MTSIRNMTQAPLQVPLGAGRVLHLGPGQSGSVAAAALALPALVRLIQARKLEVLGSADAAFETGEAGGAPREFAHGHGHPSRIFPKGNRGG